MPSEEPEWQNSIYIFSFTDTEQHGGTGHALKRPSTSSQRLTGKQLEQGDSAAPL
jgi:hypothetical protein